MREFVVPPDILNECAAARILHLRKKRICAHVRAGTS